MILRFEQHALRDLKKIEKPERKLILDALHELSQEADPLQNSNVKKISNAPSSWYRYRIRKYRVIFDADGNILRIIHVRKRSEKTYRNL